MLIMVRLSVELMLVNTTAKECIPVVVIANVLDELHCTAFQMWCFNHQAISWVSSQWFWA